jgi:hypothetical protein
MYPKNTPSKECESWNELLKVEGGIKSSNSKGHSGIGEGRCWHDDCDVFLSSKFFKEVTALPPNEASSLSGG